MSNEDCFEKVYSCSKENLQQWWSLLQILFTAGVNFLKTVFVWHWRGDFFKEVKDVAFKCTFGFVWNLENDFHESQLVRLDVQNIIKWHSWPDANHSLFYIFLKWCEHAPLIPSIKEVWYATGMVVQIHFGHHSQNSVSEFDTKAKALFKVFCKLLPSAC